MDKEIIFLIIIFLFSLISNLLNKKKKQQQKRKTTQNDSGDSSQPRKKPFSFEDILKEFEAETLGKPREEEPQPQPDPADYRKEAEVKERALNEKERYMDKAPAVEGTESKYTTYEGSSYELVDDDEIQMPEELGVSKRDKHYDIDKEESNRFAEILHDEDGLKKAIILNEILRRKY